MVQITFEFKRKLHIDSKIINLKTKQVGVSEYKYVVYEVPSGNEVKDSEAIEKITWDQWTR